MLSPADAALAARDPAIPGLATLLDSEAFAATLRSAVPAVEIGAVTPTYVRYKPGTNCLVAYRLNLPTGPALVYARAYSAALRDKLAHADRLRERPGSLGIGGIALAPQAIAIYCWPYDRELPALTQLERSSRRNRLFAEICPSRPDLGESQLVTLRYRPERRYVGRLQGTPGNDALLKLYCVGDYAQARAASAAFRATGSLRLATPLGYDDETRAIMFPWLPGIALAERLWGKANAPDALRTTGAALAALHHQTAGVPRRSNAPLAALAASASALTTLCPELSARIRRLYTKLEAMLREQSVVPRPIHGDFYADQVLLDDDRATLLDLDNAHWGDPAADLGTFMAHLRRAAVLGKGTLYEATTLGEAIYEGYAAYAPPPDLARVRGYTAIGLLQLAPEPFRYRARNWPAQVATLVAAAEDALWGEHAWDANHRLEEMFDE